MSKFRDITRPLRHSLRKLRWPRVLQLDFYLSIINLPVQLLVTKWATRRFRDLVFGLPALALIIVLLVLIGRGQLQRASIASEYFVAAEKAMTKKDYAEAELLLNRVLEEDSANLSDARFAMAVLLDDTGRQPRAAEMFSKLAPEGSHGNPNAHRRLGVILANATTVNSPPDEIRRLYWHLNAANDHDSTAMSMAWGRYFLAVRDLKSAKEYFEKAVEDFPELWQVLATIELTAGNNSSAISSYKRASDYLSGQLRDDPKNNRTRVDYAQVLMRLGQLNEARIVLEQGVLLDEDGPWKWLLANLAVNYHDLMAAEGKSVSILLGYVRKALEHDANHGPALNRLMSYATANVEENGSLRKILAKVIAEGREPALAHLAMGNLCWIEDNTKVAMFHFEQASSLRDDMAVVMNNLAWLVAHHENLPDYDRALALVEQSLEQNPEDPRFLDTRGTILLLKKEWKQSLVDLEKALVGIENEHKKAVHKKLAEAYSELNLPEIADQHRAMSE